MKKIEYTYYELCKKCKKNYAEVDNNGLCPGCKRLADHQKNSQDSRKKKPIPQSRIQRYAAALPWEYGKNSCALQCCDGYSIKIRLNIHGRYYSVIFQDGKIIDRLHVTTASIFNAQVKSLRNLKEILDLGSKAEFKNLLR